MLFLFMSGVHLILWGDLTNRKASQHTSAALTINENCDPGESIVILSLSVH